MGSSRQLMAATCAVSENLTSPKSTWSFSHQSMRLGCSVVEANIGFRVQSHEVLNKVIHVAEADRIDRSHCEHDPPPPRPASAPPPPAGKITLDERTTSLVIHLSLCGQHKWPLRTVDQPHAQDALPNGGPPGSRPIAFKPLLWAALEKLRRLTTSQKIFSDFRFTAALTRTWIIST